MTKAARRLRRIELTLRAGRMPIIRQYTPGVEELLKKYGMQDFVFVPSAAMTFQQVQVARIKWKENKRYKRDKENIGESVNVKEKTQLKIAKANLLKMMKEV